MQENRWARIVLLALAGIITIIVLTLYIAGYFYLWHIGENAAKTTPLTWLQYWFYWGEVGRVKLKLIVCMVLAILLIGAPVITALLPKKRSLHGDAKFATWKEIKEAGLNGEKGIIVGAWDGFFGLTRKYLLLAGQLGVLLAAPPRSGKGAGVVNTNMLNWPDSGIVLDIRQESWRVTSGFRQANGQECYLFNPVAEDGRSCQWNPLHYVSDDPVLRINDLQKIGNMLSPNPAEGDPFWPASCRILFVGLALYVFETEGLSRTFGEIVRQIMFGEGESVGDHWKKILADRDAAGNPLSEVCKSALYDFIFTSANTQSSIRKTFTSKLELWLNPLVDVATSGNSFDLRDFRKKKISLYIGILPGDLARVSLITNLLFQQFTDLNTREMPEDNPALKYQVLMMMDEFTSMGKMQLFESAVSYLGGYNLRVCIIIQGPSQLRQTYGQEGAQTIMDCMGAQIVFAPKEMRHAKDISEALGYETVKDHSTSKSATIDLGKGSRGSVSTNEKARALLLPQEVKEIGPLKEIIFIENIKPILCSKIRYFKDKTFTARLRAPVKIKALKAEVKKPVIRTKPVEKPAASQGGEMIQLGGEWIEMKDIQPEDLARLDKLELRDFSGKFDTVTLPKGDPITDSEMKTAVDSFLDSLTL